MLSHRRSADLEHEVLDDTMEVDAVVEPLLDQRQEVACRVSTQRSVSPRHHRVPLGDSAQLEHTKSPNTEPYTLSRKYRALFSRHAIDRPPAMSILSDSTLNPRP